jgi:hypothetical protein
MSSNEQRFNLATDNGETRVNRFLLRQSKRVLFYLPPIFFQHRGVKYTTNKIKKILQG